MKKNLLLIAFLLNITNVSFAQNNSKNETDAVEADNPDIANDRDFEMTKDPALGYPPSERMQAVRDIIGQGQTSQTSFTSLGPLNWEERGPSTFGGRTRAIMFDPNDGANGYKKVWAGGVAGGLWYTDDITLSGSSLSWTHVSEFWDNLAISCIAYDPRIGHTNDFYVGTGEGWFNTDAVRGAGIWKSSDGGGSWVQLNSTIPIPGINENFYFVQKIVVHPVTGYIYVATHSGIMCSQDGGSSWARVFGTPTTKVADIEISAAPTYEILASAGIHYADGIFSSLDGITWTRINDGTNVLPTSSDPIGRIELSCSPSDPSIVYAMVEHLEFGIGVINGLHAIYKRNSAGTWVVCTLPQWHNAPCNPTSDDMTNHQAFYDLIAQVDPNDPTSNTLIVGGIDLLKTTDGGSSWTQLTSWYGGCGYPYIHADQHGILFQPNSANILHSNDGGVYFYTNGVGYESKNFGYNITQFYSCDLNPAVGVVANPNNFLGGTQDNGTIKFDSPGINTGISVYGGDGGLCFIDQETPLSQINSYVFNNFLKTNDNWSNLSPLYSNSGCAVSTYFIDPSDYDSPSDVFFFVSENNSLPAPCNGAISYITSPFSAFTTEVKLNIAGFSGLFTTGLTTFVKVAPHNPGTQTNLYVGTYYGQIFKITDIFGTPVATDIRDNMMPNNASISCIEFGASESQILVTFSNYGVVSVWETLDGGSSWSQKDGDLLDMPVRYALYNPNDYRGVLLATEAGVWSTDDITAPMVHWTTNPNEGLSRVRVDMLKTRPYDNLVIAATHGRGLFSSQCVFTQPVAKISNVCPSGNTINFTDASTNAINSTYLWDFGDGNTSTLMNPSHTYGAVGIYTVTLTITNNPSGCNSATSVQVAMPGSIIHLGSTTINATEVFMADGSTIEVQATDILKIINGSYLHACNNNWNGIVVLNGGTLNMDNSKIEDAINAIEMQDGATVNVTTNTFDKNTTDVFAHDGDFSNSVFTGNTFKYSPLPEFDERQPLTHISLSNVSNIIIGGGTSISEQNQFENKEYGIFASASNLNSFNNKFFHIGKNKIDHGFIIHQGSAILDKSQIANNNSLLVSDNFGASLPNKFLICYSAIITSEIKTISILNNNTITNDGGFESCNNDIYLNNFEGAFANIEGNDFLDYWSGIYASGVGLNATITIKNNWFNYVSQTIPMFYNFTLASGTLRYANSSINIQANQQTPVYLNIFDNKISNSAIGVHLRNIQSFHGTPTVFIGDPNLPSGTFSNKVNYVSVPVNVLQSSSPPNIGYWVENGDNISIANNLAKGASGTPALGMEQTYRGFSLDNITNSILCTNKAEKTGTGVWAYNKCAGTQFHGTTNTSCFHGFHLLNADLPTQGTFTTSWHGWDNEWSSVPQNDIVGSTYLHQQLSWYYDPSCTPCIPYAPTLSPDVNALQPASNLQDCIAPQPAPDQKRDEEFGTAISDNTEYNDFPDENKYHDKEFFFKAASEDPTLLYLGTASDAIYQDEYDSLSNTNMGTLKQVDEHVKNESYTIAQSVNQAIIPLNQTEQNKKDVNEIFIYARQHNDTLDSARTEILRSIALQDIIHGGEAVINARARLNMDVIDDPVGYYRLSKPGNQNAPNSHVVKGKLIPNPASSEVTFNYTHSDTEQVCVRIYDVYGNQIYENKLAGNTLTFHVADYIQSIYFIHVFVNDLEKENHRLIIIR